jgi:GMP synthase-like glutamine amidotransferase
MICYVDMAHPLLLADPARRQQHLGQRLDTALRLQAIAGMPCLYRHYRGIDRDFIRQYGIRALVLSGIGSHWRQYDWGEFAGLADVVRAGDTPVLGMCGGHLVLGHFLGALVTRLGRLQDGEADTGEYMPGWRKEWGFLPIELLVPDPLFDGLGDRPMMYLAHGRALKTAPPGCTLLATRPTCRVQAIRRDGYPIYGVQFHPELFTDEFPAGRRMLANFFALAGVM